MSDAAITRPDSETIVYKGRVYLRPCDRGVCLENATFDDLFGSGDKSEPYADDLFHALKSGDYFNVEITVKRTGPPLEDHSE